MRARRHVFSILLSVAILAPLITTSAQQQAAGSNPQAAPLTAAIPLDQAITTGTFSNAG